MIVVRPIGTARQGYRVETHDGSWDVRTQSAKRYLVVDMKARAIAKRTSDRETARRTARKIDERRGELGVGVIIDRRIIDATAAGFLDLGGAS